MNLKGTAASLLLWLLLTLALVLMSGWMHQLANRTPSHQDARQINLTLQYEVQQLQDLLHWVATLPAEELAGIDTPADLRLIVDSSDVLLFHVSSDWEKERQALLVSLVNFLNQPLEQNLGVTYWRDQVLLVAVHRDGDRKYLAGMFLNGWLRRLVDATGIQLRLVTGEIVDVLRRSGHAVLPLPAMLGKPVYIEGKPVLLNEAIPFRWWLAVPTATVVAALIVWFFHYRPVWRRLRGLLLQMRGIMQGSTFRERLQPSGKDEIGELVVQFNSLLSSLEYSYNLMAKTNLVTTELLSRVDVAPAALPQPTDEQALKQSLDMASRLSGALQRKAIELYLQPVFGRDRTTVTGYEALSRWMDPELGMVLPLEYLAVAEKAGLTDPLTELMLHQTFDLLRRLPGSDQEPLMLSVNLSAAQLFAPGLMQFLERCEKEDRKLFARLELEVKESTLTRDFDLAAVIVGRLRELGIGVCIDDFGLSRYSLMYLQKLPVTAIKLARVFSERISREPREVAFIEGVARFAGGLGVRVIVKNLENEQQLLSLRPDLPVEYQGLALGGPMPVADVIRR
ncbi:MAG TPA: EAL domain-containing protein [Candidatus Kapabacteria bacterium]|nr:EAL domain-containing protein [Candidatus Kapabacteria bacterium]